MQKNFATIEKDFKQCTLVNLVSRKKKEEKKLGEYYEKIYIATGSWFDFKWLDFEEESKKMSKSSHQALSFVDGQLEQYGYFSVR